MYAYDNGEGSFGLVVMWCPMHGGWGMRGYYMGLYQ